MSRTDARSSALWRRPARTVPAAITAIVLTTLGVGLGWAATVRLAQGSWPGFATATGSWIASLTWGSALLLLVCVAVTLLGLVALVAALKPGAPTAMTLASTGHQHSVAADTEVAMPRRAVAKLATARASTVDGVDSVSASVGSRRVLLAIRTPSERRAEIEQEVTASVVEALRVSGLTPVPAVSARVRTHRP